MQSSAASEFSPLSIHTFYKPTVYTKAVLFDIRKTRRKFAAVNYYEQANRWPE